MISSQVWSENENEEIRYVTCDKIINRPETEYEKDFVKNQIAKELADFLLRHGIIEFSEEPFRGSLYSVRITGKLGVSIKKALQEGKQSDDEYA